MNQIRLTDWELVYLAAQAGAMRFYGIPDPFFAMNTTEVRSAVAEIKHSLHTKGYAEEGFDSEFTISEDVLSFVKVCALCERYLVAALSGTGDGNFRIIAYCQGSQVVLLREGEKGEYLLEKADVQMLDKLLTGIDLSLGFHAPVQEFLSVSLPFQTLSRAQKKTVPEQDEPGAQAFLKETGLPEIMTKVLLAGFRGTTPCLNVNLVDLRGRRSDGFLSFATPEAQIRMSPIWLDEEESWQISYTTASGLVDAIRELTLACFGASVQALS